ncbi:type I restriction-modification system DNA methylase subunit [Flavobacterium sp. CG_9.10]|uniref:Eco57I restriction-modification methylase domain-containing protein n=1 Tax=Flavobacterium sp. CG_9.10 TaxID=2787729 RepID=UPI001A2966F8|nr:DNA methyltransferase [Flavobacterium sp. CG_9.10]MBG6111711.1 type I restriction-modification system DNA methylase subunit [Flavobacterium sp. CG_9.10]
MNPKVQDEIKSLKEEQYQGEFLEDLFVKILGYTKPASSSETQYNLTTEYKNIKDSKKADGAIIIDTKVKAVIELKGTNTTDLGKIEAQAFGYKNNQQECVYVITSNFEKLRFYIDNAIEHIEFNLFTLTQEDFSLLYLCLGYENIANDIAKKIKEESLSEEDVITKKLYKDYSVFKRELYQSLVQLNPDYEPLELFKKSQKLLDRFLFLLFGEDRNLLPPNSVKLILSQWNQLRELDEYTPLYDRFKKYFGYLNTGYKGKQYDVFAYNGGLFKPDEILDSITIDDDLLYKHTLKLSEYDFASEVDVNILGHIFENSLNELDEIKAQLEGAAIDKSKTKRKKDGVFYTPKYITKYIVENTVGKLCDEKKIALEIIEEDYFTDKKRQKKTVKGLIDKLEDYRKWLLQLTICDPACGSGAFLNQALDFLIDEHRYIDELQAKLFGDAMVLTDMENSILENNLFGVDLNEESVEIAKLSLWLRTAQPNRKLNDLSSNIKCGNSLLDDAAIAGDKAFNWQNEFPKVFDKGGFDVIIGNPPYIKEATNKNAFNGLHSHPCYQGKMDLWYFFGWDGLELVKPENGLVAFIAPNNWITNDGASNFRNKVLRDSVLIEFIDFGDFKVFESAGIQTMIYVMRRSNLNSNYLFEYSKIIDKKILSNEIQDFLLNLKSIKTEIYKARVVKINCLDNMLSFSNESNEIILSKIELKGDFKLEKEEINSGIDIGQDFVNSKSKLILGKENNIGDGVFNLSKSEYSEYNFTEIEKKILKPFYTTKEINRYLSLNKNKYWVIYTSSKFKNPEEIIPYPNIKSHLDKFTEIITSDNKPYGLHRTRNEKIFKGEKILSIRKCTRPSFSYVDFDSYVNRTYNVIQTTRINLKYLTLLLNSKLVRFWLKEKGKLQGEIFQVDMNPILSIPLINKSKDKQLPFIEKADLMPSLNKEFYEHSQKFQRTIQRKFDLEELPKKLQDWYLLHYPEFIKELAKKKVKLSLSQEAEWEDYFMEEGKKVLELKSQIDTTDKTIDKMVYELYGLSEEEIEIVENS